MPRSHLSKKQCVAIMASVVAFVVVIFVLTGPAVFSATVDEKSDTDTLELLHVVFRHGPRTPADTYPNDPHVNQTFHPFGWGHITNHGKRELFGIGTWLRKRYGDFMAPYYHPDVGAGGAVGVGGASEMESELELALSADNQTRDEVVHAQATGVARTHMTLQTVLASFFPPKNTPMEWNPRYNWQPIPIFSQALNEDTLLLVRTPCPRYHEALKEVQERPEVKAEVEPYADMYRELSELTGMNFTEPEDVQSLYLTLLAEQEFGLELPEWTKRFFPEKLQFLTEQSYVYNIYTPELQKIKAGPFLKQMFTEMQEKRDGKLKPDKRKLFIYTGHDTTVVNVLSALKIWERQLPRYSVMTIFELHKNKESGEYYVEIYFRNNPKAPAQRLTVPGCDFQCPLDKLLELSKDVVPTEADADRCASKTAGFTEPPLRGP